LWDTSNSLSWSRPIRSSGEILLNLLKLKLSLKSSGRPDRAPSSDSISLWSSFNSVNLMFHSTRFCKSRFRRKCHQTPSHLTLTVAGPISVLILLYDRSMLFSSCRPTISWNENSVSLLSVMFIEVEVLQVQQRVVQRGDVVVAENERLEYLVLGEVLSGQLQSMGSSSWWAKGHSTYGADVVVFQNHSHQLPGFAQGPVETLDLVVLEEEGFELRQRLELLGQLLDLVVGEVDHLQVFGVQGELPLEVRQLVGVGEEPVEVG
jgi:hypothetical protein